MTTKAERETLPSANQHLQHDHDLARSLHRVVRAMHDGECPKCHKVHASAAMEVWDRSGNTGSGERFYTGWRCPSCKFAISKAEATAALEQFAPFMEQNLAVFEKWRAERNSPTPAASSDGLPMVGGRQPVIVLNMVGEFVVLTEDRDWCLLSNGEWTSNRTTDEVDYLRFACAKTSGKYAKALAIAAVRQFAERDRQSTYPCDPPFCDEPGVVVHVTSEPAGRELPDEASEQLESLYQQLQAQTKATQATVALADELREKLDTLESHAAAREAKLRDWKQLAVVNASVLEALHAAEGDGTALCDSMKAAILEAIMRTRAALLAAKGE